MLDDFSAIEATDENITTVLSAVHFHSIREEEIPRLERKTIPLMNDL